MPASDIYQMVTDRMITALETGTVPWQKPWSSETGGIPRSIATGKEYRGINTLLLTLTAMTEGYASPWWGTYDRIAELSGMMKNPKGRGWISPDGTLRGVRRGEHQTKVVWWKRILKPDPNDPTKTVQWITGGVAGVFNASQADQMPARFLPTIDELKADIGSLPEPEKVLREYIDRGPALRYEHQNRAYYQPELDRITLPERNQFDSVEGFYGTAFHEATHSTGHKNRLNRPDAVNWTGFGSHGYGREELCAEMGSAFLCASTGVESTFDNSAAYLSSWLKTIRGDVKLVSQAASQAQASTDLIMGVTHDYEGE